MGMGWDGLVKIGSAILATADADFGKKGTILERSGMRGTREHNIADNVAGVYSVAGSVTLEPSVSELYNLIAWVLGSSDALYPLAVEVDRSQAAYRYPLVCPNSLEISGSEGSIVTATLDLLGTTEGSASALSAPSSTEPLRFFDMALTLNSIVCQPKSITFRVANELETRFLNSQTNQLNASSTMNSQDRIVTLTAVVPYDATHTTLYDMAATGIDGSLTIGTITLTFGKLVAPAESAPLSGKGEIMLTLNLTAKRDGNDADVSIATSSA